MSCSPCVLFERAFSDTPGLLRVRSPQNSYRLFLSPYWHRQWAPLRFHGPVTTQTPSIQGVRRVPTHAYLAGTADAFPIKNTAPLS